MGSGLPLSAPLVHRAEQGKYNFLTQLVRTSLVIVINVLLEYHGKPVRDERTGKSGVSVSLEQNMLKTRCCSAAVVTIE